MFYSIYVIGSVTLTLSVKEMRFLLLAKIKWMYKLVCLLSATVKCQEGISDVSLSVSAPVILHYFIYFDREKPDSTHKPND